MPCAGALNPADHYHPTLKKADGYAARFSVIATRIGEGEGRAVKHPGRVEKIQPPLTQSHVALCRVAGNSHNRIVYTKNGRVTVILRVDKVIE